MLVRSFANFIPRVVIGALAVAFVVMAFSDVGAFVDSGRRAVILVGSAIIPVLFPFFFIGGLLCEILSTRNSRKAPNIAIAVTLGVLSGFPTGAKLLGNLHSRAVISTPAAIRLSPFISTASPIFTIATVGVALFESLTFGLVIYVAHILAATIVGSLFTLTKMSQVAFHPGPAVAELVGPLRSHELNSPVGDIISRSLHGAISSVMAVAGLVIVFFILSAPMDPYTAGVFEMTTGIFRASETLGGVGAAVVVSAMLGFGGLCIAAQGLVFTRAYHMPAWYFFAYKTAHALLAVAIVVPLYMVFLG